ncbi:hypothetical protein JCM10212_001098 [Sporobolomyces blumeae]
MNSLKGPSTRLTKVHDDGASTSQGKGKKSQTIDRPTKRRRGGTRREFEAIVLDDSDEEHDDSDDVAERGEKGFDGRHGRDGQGRGQGPRANGIGTGLEPSANMTASTSDGRKSATTGRSSGDTRRRGKAPVCEPPSSRDWVEPTTKGPSRQPRTVPTRSKTPPIRDDSDEDSASPPPKGQNVQKIGAGSASTKKRTSGGRAGSLLKTDTSRDPRSEQLREGGASTAQGSKRWAGGEGGGSTSKRDDIARPAALDASRATSQFGRPRDSSSNARRPQAPTRSPFVRAETGTDPLVGSSGAHIRASLRPQDDETVDENQTMAPLHRMAMAPPSHSMPNDAFLLAPSGPRAWRQFGSYSSDAEEEEAKRRRLEAIRRQKAAMQAREAAAAAALKNPDGGDEPHPNIRPPHHRTKPAATRAVVLDQNAFYDDAPRPGSSAQSISSVDSDASSLDLPDLPPRIELPPPLARRPRTDARPRDEANRNKAAAKQRTAEARSRKAITQAKVKAILRARDPKEPTGQNGRGRSTTSKENSTHALDTRGSTSSLFRDAMMTAASTGSRASKARVFSTLIEVTDQQPLPATAVSDDPTAWSVPSTSSFVASRLNVFGGDLSSTKASKSKSRFFTAASSKRPYSTAISEDQSTSELHRSAMQDSHRRRGPVFLRSEAGDVKEAAKLIGESLKRARSTR